MKQHDYSSTNDHIFNLIVQHVEGFFINIKNAERSCKRTFGIPSKLVEDLSRIQCTSTFLNEK